MSLVDIINELLKLTLAERHTIYQSILQLDGETTLKATTPEMIAAIDESIRSAASELSFSPEELRRVMGKWLSTSK